MSFDLTHPYYLFWLTLIALLVAAHRRSLVDFTRRQRLISLIVRTVILTFIVFALAGLTLVLPTQQTMIVLLTDQSRSIDTASAEQRDLFVELCRNTIPPDRFGGVFPFGTADSTDIAAALNPSLAVVPPGYVPHLVIITDGNETHGDVLTAAVRSGAIVSTVPLPSSSEPEVQVADLKMPHTVRQGEPFYIDVVILSNVETEGNIALYKGPYKLLDETKQLQIGENVFRFRQTMDNQRQQEFTVTLSAKQDTILDNNRLTGLVFADGKPRVLIIDSEPRTIRDFTSALREQEITAEVRPPEGVPRTLEDLNNFEAVVLSNVPATAMSNSQMNLLRAYVSELGGGLVMLGSEQTFGLGGYYKTPIEEVLPVQCDFKKEQEKPSLAMCLVIDRSGSMGGQKMELAKDAAKAAVELLTPQDFAAVIAFDNETYVIVPMQSTATTSAIMSAISTIEAAGGTNIYPALAEAYEQLRRIPARLKHVILLTDGYSAPGDFEGISRQFARDQMTVSTVGVGESDNALLKSISDIGRGRHYECEDPQAIPQIFAKETMTASKSAIKETPFMPIQITATAVLRQIDMDTAPPLLGYVMTKPKPTAQFILATETGDPLLLWWRFGLGQTAAFSSDAKSRWGAEWIGWEHFAKFWAQVIRHTMRRSDQHGSTLELETSAEGIRLTLDSMDELNGYINEAAGSATLIHPDLSKEEWTLSQTAPGRYEANIPLAESNQSVYHLQMELKLGGKTLESQSRSMMTRYSDELRIRPTNETLLRQLAELTGGGYDVSASDVADWQTSRSARKALPLWSWLLTLAAMLFVFDVLLRRVEIF
jgi:uncharacterized membrane protein